MTSHARKIRRTMQRHEAIMPHLLTWEGTLSRDTNDSASKNPCPIPHNGKSGWHTNMGVTWTTWSNYCKAKGIKDINVMAAKFFTMTKADTSDIFKVLYWDKVNAGAVKSLPVANIIAQWAWGSGPQGALGNLNSYVDTKETGTYKSNWKDSTDFINAQIDKEGERTVFNEMCEIRKQFFIKISQPGSKNAKFQKGWLNRLKAFITFNEQFFGKGL